MRGECGQGAGIWCLRLSPCRAFDRAKQPQGRDIWLWPIEDWYQFRRGNQDPPSRLSESHTVGESYEVFICFNRHNPILYMYTVIWTDNVYFQKVFIFKFPSDCKPRLIIEFYHESQRISYRPLIWPVLTCWADVIKHFTFHYYNSMVNLPGVTMLFKIRDASGERKYLITASNLTELTSTLNKSSKSVLLKCSFIRFI